MVDVVLYGAIELEALIVEARCVFWLDSRQNQVRISCLVPLEIISFRRLELKFAYLKTVHSMNDSIQVLIFASANHDDSKEVLVVVLVPFLAYGWTVPVLQVVDVLKIVHLRF